MPTPTTPSDTAAAPAAPVAAAPATSSTPSPASSAPAAAAAAPVAETPKEAAPPPAAKAVEIEVTLPKGVEYDPSALKDFKAIFSDEKLSPSQRAQAVLDLDQKLAKSYAARKAEESKKSEADEAKKLEEQTKQFREKDILALKADKDFGGAKYDETTAAAKAALRQFGGDEASQLLESAGLSNHPAIVKMLARVRAGTREDSTTGNMQAPAPTPKGPPALSQTRRIATALYSKPQAQK